MNYEKEVAGPETGEVDMLTEKEKKTRLASSLNRISGSFVCRLASVP